MYEREDLPRDDSKHLSGCYVEPADKKGEEEEKKGKDNQSRTPDQGATALMIVSYSGSVSV